MECMDSMALCQNITGGRKRSCETMDIGYAYVWNSFLGDRYARTGSNRHSWPGKVQAGSMAHCSNGIRNLVPFL